MPKLCHVEGCVREHYAKDVCKMHYHQLWKFGEIRERNRHTPNKIIQEGTICKVECYNRFGKVTGYAIIDSKDLEIISPYKWHFNSNYVVGYLLGGTTEKVLMHRIILNAPDTFKVDHKDGNTWDNRRDNIRICTQQQNNCNAKNKTDRRFKGVYKVKNGFAANISYKGIQYRIGLFPTEIDAAIAYNNRARELHGEFAKLNLIG